MREEDEAHSHQDSMHKSVKKMEETSKKISEKIIPIQMEVMGQLVKQIENMEKISKNPTFPKKSNSIRKYSSSTPNSLIRVIFAHRITNRERNNLIRWIPLS